MMASRVKRFDEINITPLTDIFLVLLIIMMVVAPVLSQQNNAIETPMLFTGASLNKNLITVDITKEGETTIQGEVLTQEALVAKIEKLLPTVTEPKVIVRADKATQSKHVLSVMKAVALSGVERIIFEGQTAQTPVATGDVETSEARVLNAPEEAL